MRRRDDERANKRDKMNNESEREQTRANTKREVVDGSIRVDDIPP